MNETQRETGFPLAALHGAFDELAGRRSCFHARGTLAADVMLGGWRVVSQSDSVFDAAGGQFTAPSSGYYVFMASSSGGARLWLCRNDEVAAEALDDQTPLVVAALRLAVGDTVTLHAAGGAGAVEWRGVRG